MKYGVDGMVTEFVIKRIKFAVIICIVIYHVTAVGIHHDLFPTRIVKIAICIGIHAEQQGFILFIMGNILHGSLSQTRPMLHTRRVALNLTYRFNLSF